MSVKAVRFDRQRWFFFFLRSSLRTNGWRSWFSNSWTLEYISYLCQSLALHRSAEFKILANRLTTVFLQLQMKNISEGWGDMQFPICTTAHSAPCNVFDRTDILYRCEMGKRVTFLFMVAYACNDSLVDVLTAAAPEPSENKQELQGASSSTALLNTRILTKTNCWKSHCQILKDIVSTQLTAYIFHLKNTGNPVLCHYNQGGTHSCGHSVSCLFGAPDAGAGCPVGFND